MKKGAWANIPRKEIAAIRSASARTFIALATRSNGSSTGSNNVVVWRRATTSLRETTLPSSNSHLPGYGGPRVMSPRPSLRRVDVADSIHPTLLVGSLLNVPCYPKEAFNEEVT